MSPETLIQAVLEDAVLEVKRSPIDSDLILKRLAHLSLNEDDKKDLINKLRQHFIDILNNEDKTFNLETRRRIYDCLISMAKTWPYNDECVISLLALTERAAEAFAPNQTEPIQNENIQENAALKTLALQPENQIFSYTGYRYYKDLEGKNEAHIHDKPCPHTRKKSVKALNLDPSKSLEEANTLVKAASINGFISLTLFVGISTLIGINPPESTVYKMPMLEKIVCILLPALYFVASLGMTVRVFKYMMDLKALINENTFVSADLQLQPLKENWGAAPTVVSEADEPHEPFHFPSPLSHKAETSQNSDSAIPSIT